MHCQNVCVVFNFAETVHTRNSQNKSHAKYKNIKIVTVACNSTKSRSVSVYKRTPGFEPITVGIKLFDK